MQSSQIEFLEQKQIALRNRILAHFSGYLAVLLVITAIIPDFPYQWYTMVRWFVFFVSIFAVYQRIKIEKYFVASDRADIVLVVYLILGFVFNPIIPFSLSRDIWFLIDLAGAVATTNAIGLYNKETTTLLETIEQQEMISKKKRTKDKVS